VRPRESARPSCLRSLLGRDCANARSDKKWPRVSGAGRSGFLCERHDVTVLFAERRIAKGFPRSPLTPALLRLAALRLLMGTRCDQKQPEGVDRSSGWRLRYLATCEFCEKIRRPPIDKLQHCMSLLSSQQQMLNIAHMSEGETRDAQIGFRIKPSLKAELERLAKADRRSLASYLEILLEAHVADAKRKEGKKR
jgi:hypothetical protein